MSDHIFDNPNLRFKDYIPSGKTTWQSPSNIALVKYWGKKPVQIPMNPSISFTLKNSYTETTVEYKPAENGFDLQFFFEGKRNETFEDKTKKFFKNIISVFPFINQLTFTIRSKNSFPHSAGIASSASGMSALALALCDIENTHFNTLKADNDFFKKASYVARLGSGSASRSVYGGLTVWGKSEFIPGSSNLYAVAVTDYVHPDFLQYRDTILLVDSSEKKVSSRAGHALMKTNIFAKVRFEQAKQNLKRLMDIMKAGDRQAFVKQVESEALTLHAMMMTSTPYYLLIKPNTLQIINKIFEFRNDTKIPVCFTLDAGPNVHLLYGRYDEEAVNRFISLEIKPFLSKKGVIQDYVGKGPEKK